MALSLTACQGMRDSDELRAMLNSTSGSRTSSAGQDSGSSESTGSAPTATKDPGILTEEEEQKLYNAYIDTNNYMVDRVEDSISRYFKYVEFQEEFKLVDEEDGYFDCYSISDYKMETMKEAYETAGRKSEKSALDQAYLDLYPSLEALMNTLNRIYEYTDMKSYLDDDYERAREYHAALMEALEGYDTAGEVFMAELGDVAAQRQKESLEQMKEEGYEALYAINMVIILANEIEAELYKQGVWDENILDMDLEVIQPLYDEFVENVEAVVEYSKDEEKLRQEGISGSASLSMFVSAMKDTKTSLTEVLQKVKNGEALDRTDLIITSIPGNCSLSSFDAGLSDMISNYNSFIAR